MSMFGGLQGTDLLKFGMGVLGGRDLNHGIAQGLQASLPGFERRQAKKKWEDQLAKMDVSPKMRQALTMMGPDRGSAMYAHHLFKQAQPKPGPQQPWFVQQDGSLHPAKRQLMAMRRGPQRERRNLFAERAQAAKSVGLSTSSPDYKPFVLTGKLQQPKQVHLPSTDNRSNSMPEPIGMNKNGEFIFAQTTGPQFNVTPLQRNEQPTGSPAPPVPTTSVPQVVVNPKSKNVDRFATEQLRGFAATMAATPEQRQRLQNMKMQQSAWARTYGKAPAGWYYGPDGQLLSLKESPPSISQQQSDKADEMLKRQQSELADAEKVVLSAGQLGRAFAQNADQSAAGRFSMSVFGGEKTAQAFTDYEQSVLSIVYNLSGKTTTNSEMERFLSAYMPRSGESDARVKEKTQKIRGMLTALQSAKAKGKRGDAAMRIAVSDWRRHVPGAKTTRSAIHGRTKQDLQSEMMRRLERMTQ